MSSTKINVSGLAKRKLDCRSRGVIVWLSYFEIFWYFNFQPMFSFFLFLRLNICVKNVVSPGGQQLLKAGNSGMILMWREVHVHHVLTSCHKICRTRFDKKKKEKKLTYCLTLLMKKHCSSYCLTYCNLLNVRNRALLYSTTFNMVHV